MVIRALQYLAVRAVLGAVSLAAYMVFSRLVEPGAWGRASLVTTAATALSSCLFGWMGVALLREQATEAAWGERLAALPRLFAAAAGLTAVLAAGAAATGLAPWPLCALGLGLTVAMAAFELSLSLAQARHRVGLFAAKSVVRGVGALGLGWVAAAGGGGEIGLLAATIAALALTLALFARADVGPLADMLRRRPEPGRSRTLIAFGWPIAAGIGLGWALDMVDRFLIAALRGEAEAGLYAMGYDVARYPLWMVIAASSLAALPAAAKAFDEGGGAAARPVMASNLLTLLMATLPLLCLEMLLPHQLAPLVLGPAYAETAAGIMPLVALGVMLQGLRAYVLDITIHLSRRTRPLVLMLGWATAANVALNLALVPAFGLKGAAMATVLSQLVPIAYWALFIRHWDMLGADWGELGRLALALALFAVVAVAEWHPAGQGWFMARLVLAGLVYAAALVALDVGGLGTELRRRLVRSDAEEVP